MIGQLNKYPIAKNLFSLSKQMYYAVETGQELEMPILPMGHWIWDKSNRNEGDLRSGWDLYFKNWSMPTKSSSELESFLGCINAVFSPNQFTKEIIDNHKPNTQKKLIGIHVRRGDAKYYIGDSRFQKCKPVSDYKSYLQAFNSNEYALYCASDSLKETLQELKDMLPQFEIHSCELSSRIPEIPYPLDIEQFMENCSEPEVVENCVVSALVDIHNLSNCDFFIGPIHHSVYAAYSFLLFLSKKSNIEKSLWWDVSENSNTINLSRLIEISP